MEKDLLEQILNEIKGVKLDVADVKQELKEVKQELTDFRKETNERLIKLEESAQDTAEIVAHMNQELIELKKDFLQVESTTISNWSAINKLKSMMQ